MFSLSLTTGVEKVLHSFAARRGTFNGGMGTACNGSGCGTAFSVDANTGAETVLYSFCSRQNCVDGAVPQGSLIDVNGKLYGTTLPEAPTAPTAMAAARCSCSRKSNKGARD